SQLEFASISPREIAEEAFRLFQKNYDWRREVRSLSVRAIGLIPIGDPYQGDFFTDTEKHEKIERFDNAVEDIRNRFGKNAIFSASLMGDLKMPGKAGNEMKLPGMMYK
ncbi:MAG: DNA polymerase IV, partial [Christensenellaceae bacterium]|nr:DNA polymerase IV [Christensenellaceae bacterium]